MGIPIQVVETATSENLYDRGYILANPDLQVAGAQAKVHFCDYGYKENRKQITREFLESEESYRTRKFQRFSSILRLDGNGASAFPLTIGSDHFSLNDYQEESANGYYGPFAQAITENQNKLYLDLGCGLRSHVFENCLYLEVYPSLTADLIVSPDCRYPIKDNSLDGIGSFAVLEHTRKPWLVAEEIYRMLKPGGFTYIDWPFLQPLHGYPSHFFNATREGLTSLFGDVGFEIEDVRTCEFQGPNHSITWILGKFLADIPESQREKVQQMTVKEFLSHPPHGKLWQELINSASDETKSEFAAGNMLLARKKG